MWGWKVLIEQLLLVTLSRQKRLQFLFIRFGLRFRFRFRFRLRFRFRIPAFPYARFLLLKLWERIPFQIGDSPSTLFLYLCVNFHKCVSVAFQRWIWPAICAASSTVTIDFKLADIKLESSKAYLLKLEKNSILRFLNYWHFLSKCGFKHIPISQTFLYLKEDK